MSNLISPLKWAGSKRLILDTILSQLPEGNRLIEPFVGSGTVFLNANYSSYILNDLNSDLINFFRNLRDRLDFIEYAQELFTDINNSSERYYVLREAYNTTNDLIYKAALFLYLNKFGFNGLYRVNSCGRFNVPYGHHKKTPSFPIKNLLACKEKLKNAKLIDADFEIIIKSALSGDVIYVDPPYVPINNNVDIRYTQFLFGELEQIRLKNICKEIAEKKGIPILISNHDTAYTRELYSDASKLYNFDVQRNISCNGKKREKCAELLVIYGI